MRKPLASILAFVISCTLIQSSVGNLTQTFAEEESSSTPPADTQTPVEATSAEEEVLDPEADSPNIEETIPTKEEAEVPEETASAEVIVAPTETPVPAESTATADTATPEETAVSEPTPEVTSEPENEQVVVYMPAGSFSGLTSQMTVTVSYDDHTFPTGTTMRVTDVSKHEAIAAAEQSTEGDEEVIDAVAVDITFLDANNEEIQPEGAVSVSMVPYTPLETTETSTTEVIHKDDSGNTQVIDAAASAQNATFDADSFSIYVISTKDGTQVTAIATYIFHGADNQTVISTQMVKDKETVYAPATPEKDGYKFLGWSYTQNLSALQGSDPGDFTTLNPSVTATGYVNLYPVFQQVYYVFFLDDQGRVSTTKEGVSGAEISVNDVTIPLDSTHSVTGWYTEAALTNKVESVTLFDHNVTLYPKVEEGHYLYFASGEGASYVKPVFIAAGKITTAPEAPTRPGYTFKHWSASEGGAAYTFGSTIAEDTTLHAVWDAKQDTTYTVIFWKQSVNDDKNAADAAKTYDYAGSEAHTGTTGDTVSPSDSDTTKNYSGFTYNSSKSTSVTINGDGTTVLNVYYDRNVLTIHFFRLFLSGSEKIWKEDKTFTGLYGQTLKQNGYTWASAGDVLWFSKLNSAGKQSNLTFLDLFNFETLDAFGTSTEISLYGYKAREDTVINHYKQKMDGSYSLETPDISIKTRRNESFGFSNKFTGFTVDSYSADDDPWTPTEAGKYTKYASRLDIRYRRNSYKLNYYSYNKVIKSSSVLYEASLDGPDGEYNKYIPARPVELANGYSFLGWYKDKSCTVPFDFNGTMPANDVVVYAKWAPPTYNVIIHLTTEDNGATISIPVGYGKTINANDMPTVVDHKGNLIQSGDANETVTVPEDYTWLGWATKDGNGFTLFNLNKKVYEEITLYPYYVNKKIYTVTYDLGNGTGTVPADSKQYAENSYADIQSASGITPPKDQVFLYWTTPDNTKYYPGDKVKVTGNIELSAVFGETAKTASLVYHSNYPDGRDQEISIDSQTNNKAITLGSAGLEAPKGYYFAGWNTRADGKGDTYAIGTMIGIDNTSQNHLYAVWERESVSSSSAKTVTADVPSATRLVPHTSAEKVTKADQ